MIFLKNLKFIYSYNTYILKYKAVDNQTIAQVLAPRWSVPPQGCSAGWLPMGGEMEGIPRRAGIGLGRWRKMSGGRSGIFQKLVSCVLYDGLPASSSL